MSSNQNRPLFRGIETVAEVVYVPEEEEPVNRQIYKAAKTPFAWLWQGGYWVAKWTLMSWALGLILASLGLAFVTAANIVSPFKNWHGFGAELSTFFWAATYSTPLLMIFMLIILWRTR